MSALEGESHELGHGREVPVGPFDARVTEVIGKKRQAPADVQASPVPIEQCAHDKAVPVMWNST